jgi:hypothetical protein
MTLQLPYIPQPTAIDTSVGGRNINTVEFKLLNKHVLTAIVAKKVAGLNSHHIDIYGNLLSFFDIQTSRSGRRHILVKSDSKNMLTLPMIAFAAGFIDGLIKIESMPIPMMKSRNVQHISIFRYTYASPRHDFWTNVKNEADKPT